MDSFRAKASTAHRVSNIDPSTSAGLGKAYALGASECLTDAQSLDKIWSDRTGEYIVTFHALELALKAFLATHGFDATRLRKNYGHNVVRLYDEALKHGLAISYPDADKMISWVNEWHCDGVKIRYEFAESRELPMCVTLFPLVEAIITAAWNRIPEQSNS